MHQADFVRRAAQVNPAARRIAAVPPAPGSLPAEPSGHPPDPGGTSGADAPARAKRTKAKAEVATDAQKVPALFLVPRETFLLIRREADRRFAAGQPRSEQRPSAIVASLIDRARASKLSIATQPQADGGPATERLPLRLTSEQHAWVIDQYMALYGRGARGRDFTRAAVVQALLHHYLERSGISLVADATGLNRATVAAGLREIEQPIVEPGRVRASGAGRKPLTEHHPALMSQLEALVSPATRGDPMSALRWTCKSQRNLARELTARGYRVGADTVGSLLEKLGYNLQANRRTLEGASHPDRNAQFEYIEARNCEFMQSGQPVISVDAKKKELVSPFKNGGREYHPKGSAQRVKTHDFPDPELGKGLPYGVWDRANNVGWVNVGIDHDTATFAVESVRQWWKRMGLHTYPQARRLLITADAGGSNGYRTRCWKLELQKLADETGLEISVCHFPPGTSKWNKIEHRLFCHITANWRGRPLVSHETIVSLISNTTTRKGLRVEARLDSGRYPTGIKVSDAQMASLRLVLNWEEVAAALLARVHREARWASDPIALKLFEEIQHAPGAPPPARWFQAKEQPSLVIPLELASPAGRSSYFTTLTTLGAAQDISLHELCIEAYHPADAETARRVRSLQHRAEPEGREHE